MRTARLGVLVVLAALAAAELRAAPAPCFRPDRNADQDALEFLKRDLAAQAKELVEFGQEEDFWVVTILDHQHRPARRWQYVISQRQAPTRSAAFDAVRRLFVVVTVRTAEVEPD